MAQPSDANGGQRLGRPTKLTLRRLHLVVDAVSQGLPQASAAALAGVGEQTVLDWRRRGMLEKIRVDDAHGEALLPIDSEDERWPSAATWEAPPPSFDPGEWPFVVFFVALAKARADYEERLLAVIEAAAPRSWQAAAWLLERSRPATYARGDSRIRAAVDDALAAERALRPAAHDPISAEDILRKFAELDESEARRQDRSSR